MGINVAHPEVGQRQVYAARQMGQEVAQGVKSGAIDSGELGALKTTAQGNLQNVKGYAADGQITGQEQKAIAQQQVSMAKDIFEYKNNTAPAGSAPPPAPVETSAETQTSAPSVAYPELGQRQLFAARQMVQEVVQGVKSGSIDSNELSALKATGQGNVSALKGYASDGAISGQEQKAVAQGQAEMARAIYQATYSAPA